MPQRRRLAAWRENEAISRNRPRQWILRDNVLLDIAYRLPESAAQLAAIDGISSKLLDRAGKTLLLAVANAREDNSDYSPPRALDEQQKALLQAMQARVRKSARDLGIVAEVLAPKRELSAAIISGSRDSRMFSGWRRDVVGNDLLALM